MDPVQLVVELLSAEMEVPVTTERKPDRPVRMVLVSQSADASDEFLLQPRMELTCWGTTDRDARGIATSAVDVLRDAALDHPYLSAVRLETMARDEWTRTGQARYVAEVDLIINTDE